LLEKEEVCYTIFVKQIAQKTYHLLENKV